MKASLIFVCVILFSSIAFTQEKMESDMDHAFQNAKKGVYWALTNIPERKTKLDNDLIADDRLYASVTLYKEVQGVKVESTGYYNTNEVKIVVYRSNDSLEAEGYLGKKDDKTEKSK